MDSSIDGKNVRKKFCRVRNRVDAFRETASERPFAATEQNFEQNKRVLRALPAGRIYPSLFGLPATARVSAKIKAWAEALLDIVHWTQLLEEPVLLEGLRL